MQENNKSQSSDPKTNDNDEIDLIALAKTMWDGRKTIVRYTVIGILIGLVVALITPKEFSASTTMVPQTGNPNAGKLGGLSSLAAMAGFNLNSMEGMETLSPMVYPQIVGSAPFQLDLMNANYKLKNIEKPFSLFHYYTEIEKPGVVSSIKKYTIGLPGLILKSIRPKTDNQQLTTDNLISLSEEEEEIRKKLQENLSLEINDKEGYLTLTAHSKEAELSAQIAQKAQELLQQYITNFKIEKAKSQLNFVEKRYSEKQQEFEIAQEKLARFRDQNKNVSSALARTEEERLQSEYNLAYSVYSELAKQLEQAKIQVKEETPVFSVIQPVQVPNQKSKPNRPFILFIWTFLGIIIGVGVVFGKEFFSAVKQRWNEDDE